MDETALLDRLRRALGALSAIASDQSAPPHISQIARDALDNDQRASGGKPASGEKVPPS